MPLQACDFAAEVAERLLELRSRAGALRRRLRHCVFANKDACDAIGEGRGLDRIAPRHIDGEVVGVGDKLAGDVLAEEVRRRMQAERPDDRLVEGP